MVSNKRVSTMRKAFEKSKMLRVAARAGDMDEKLSFVSEPEKIILNQLEIIGPMRIIGPILSAIADGGRIEYLISNKEYPMMKWQKLPLY